MKEGTVPQDGYAIFGDDMGRVLRNVAEDLKLPLTRILTVQDQSEHSRKLITENARAAVRLIDSLIMSAQIYNGQQRLGLEPVSLQAVMKDSVQYMTAFADASKCKLLYTSSRKLDLTMAHRHALQTAVSALTYSMIIASSQPQMGSVTPEIKLSAHKDSHGVRFAIKTTSKFESSISLTSAQTLHGLSRHPLTALPFGTSAGVILAQTLLDAMSSKLQFIRGRTYGGFSAVLVPSQQLALL